MIETNGQGVDVVFDAISAENFERSYSVLKESGTLLVYNVHKAAVEATGMGGLISARP